MPEYLPTSYASVINPIGDGNCLLSALIMGMSQRNTNLDCSILRTQINDFVLNHPNKYVSQSIPRTVSQWAYDNLIDGHKSIDNRNNPLLQYTEMMRVATPYRCEYASLLEAFAFAIIFNVNLVIYQINDKYTYQNLTSKFMHIDRDTICILYIGNHYQTLVPVRYPSSITPCILPVKKARLDNADNRGKNDTATKIISTHNNNNDLINSAPNIPHILNTKSSNTSIGNENNSKTQHSISIPLSFMNTEEINQIIDHLSGMNIDDLRALYDTIYLKLIKRNGYVVDYNPTLTALLGCHSNTLLLGSSEQSKVASHYIGPYVDKNKTPLAESLDVVYEATEQAKKHPSIAEDTGTNTRFIQYVMTKILNKLCPLMEISNT